MYLLFSPHHLVDHTGIALDDLNDLIGNILIHIIRHGNAQIPVLVHLHSHIDRLQQMVTVDASENKVTLVQCFRALGTGADTDCREGMAYGSKEAALLRQSTAIGHDTESVHLQAVVVMEA